MRPDEHKKRKNTQYKKNHGIPAKGSKPDNKGQADSDVKVKSSQTKSSKDNGDEKWAKRPQAESKDAGAKKETGNFVDDDIKHFHKRTIVSNWSRYDDIPSDDDDDVPLQRGEDFNKLLAEAGGSASQFRFKDEEDWTVETEDTAANMLSLNFEHLTQAVSCIPLHQRLGISEELFSNGQMEEITTTAMENKAKYDQSLSSVENNTHMNKSELSNKSDMNFKNNSKPSTVEHEKSSTVTKKPATESKLAAHTEQPNVIPPAIINDIKPIPKNTEVVNLEDDLDMLLSIDETVKVDNKNIATSVSSVIDKDTANSTTKLKDMPSPKGSITSNAVKEEADTNNDNLEDWLDSMLDD